MKKSFLLYIDSLDILDELTDEQAGQLFKAIKSHQLNQEIKLSQILKIAFTPFKNQLERDQIKYQEKCERLRNNASKGGKASVKQKQANATKCKQIKRDSVNDSDSDSDSDSVNVTVSDKKENIRAINGLDLIAFEKYINYRREAKFKKLTKQGEILAAKKLIELGGNQQMAVVEQSITNGWQGLFELKQQNRQSAKQKENEIFNDWIDGKVIEGGFHGEQ